MSASTVNQYFPDEVSYPGETLLEKIEELGMSQAELAERMGKPEKTISAVINGKSAITPDMAIQLEQVLGMPAKFWMQREYIYREALARQKQREYLFDFVGWLKVFPVSNMIQIGWIREKSDNIELIQELLAFFGVATPKEWESCWMSDQPKAIFRISLASMQKPGAVAAWLRYGEIVASKESLPSYNESLFKSNLKLIKRIALYNQEDFQEQLKNICAEVGIAVVFTPQLPNAPICGATRWINNNPVIQLSDRYKSHDQFWFTFFHEAGHVILHGKKDFFVELENTEVGYIKEQKEKEDEANNFAANFLVPRSLLNDFIAKGDFKEAAIRRLAETVNVHPGMIVGQLRRLGILKYTQHNNLISRLELRLQ